ncbi:Fis family transcriptional regulator [Aliiglaciecola sp. LCG003]|uniref:Fis family transcriptional regulator n=1 Tax=Aliiglaciecola sp. LCG003 TaxID=3053655 RepID=UPI002572FA27|nr:Fis family transcriptional regulator [Aliiglaciecola sp. LCG003]WJG08602.1 Fis family transcriptional regulator [Aliiglaciecola sp. LCG003]
MNNTVKKLDNNVIKALTIVCETAKQQIPGFSWLTHSANYSNFPASLKVTCVFETEQSLNEAVNQQRDLVLIKSIHTQLLKVGILLKQAKHNVVFDSEEGCIEQHGGNWSKRLSQH